MCKGTSTNKMAQKMLLCLTKILQCVLSFRFCTEHHILAHFCQMLFPTKVKKLSEKKLECFGTKYIDEISQEKMAQKMK
jgi:hypothetical protein